jgi:MFS family permease
LAIVVLLFLAGIWGVVLFGYLRDRLSEVRPADSIGSFRRQLSVLQRTGPRALGRIADATSPAFTYAPQRPAFNGGASRRRREILSALLFAMSGSLVLGFIPALRVMWGLEVVLDCMFVGYIALLIRARNLKAEKSMKLRFLHSSTSVSMDPLLLRRTAGN